MSAKPAWATESDPVSKKSKKIKTKLRPKFDRLWGSFSKKTRLQILSHRLLILLIAFPELNTMVTHEFRQEGWLVVVSGA
jgi:hypothetical protein